ncbi:hypothetical protein C463_07637 [Halorubrum californiense DSM 19288]|uniref:Uncharacterized protein n=1 Tax=Halorubrum californiense DSM 19288 TaxID=1227465 RepID=M0EAL8_9EURY|nr:MULTISPECIES: hypothetical protein [Halorubrum]ELZ44810.1 hypothetical protein C463_07637 [Halorubrum californiense DSM 19288]TKX70687.1 hypothetical protein EXE40_08755 [Halorubrum sp. GN11GM_10-3_MGM]
MTGRRPRTEFLADTAAVVRSDERLIPLFLLLSLAALAVFLHYTTLILDGLPQPLPTEPIGP